MKYVDISEVISHQAIIYEHNIIFCDLKDCVNRTDATSLTSTKQ